MRNLIALLTLLPVSALAVAETGISTPQDEPSAMIVAPEFVMRPRPTDEAEFDEYVEYLVRFYKQVWN